ncbi:MAG TPA: Dyp-type peroxidase, partial [Accumulibacter sp.]|nr:Dyp-type peroxidase [Accumulibacter sp.]
VTVPATPAALWLWLRGEDRGEILHRSRRLTAALAPVFRLDETIDAFMFDGGRDLSGYEDGTENPVAQKAFDAAIVDSQEPLLGGSSFVAVQRWQHDFARLEQTDENERDLAIGRRRVDNQEIDDAPESAHVKRTAQESFTPEAFVVRRSMPWAAGVQGGLVFVAFGRSLDAFEAQLQRMVGIDDGIVDAIFKYSRPLTGAYFWCPAMVNGRLDLSSLGL